MRSIALISQKGGAGKSTLARQLAVIAGEEARSVIVDRDPQSTARKWHERRQSIEGEKRAPDLLDLDGASLPSAIKALQGVKGFLFIDTRPAVTAPEAEAARVADIVIVPVRPSPDDIEAVVDTLAMLDRLKKRALIVVTQAKNERRALEAYKALGQWHSAAVCPAHISERVVFQDAAMAGLGVTEMQGAAARAAERELREVWAWVKEIGGE